MDRNLLQQVRQRLEGAQRILIASHVRPDGDAVCSVLGLGLALQAQDKQVQMVLADGVPAGFEHLAGVEQIVRRAASPVDLVVSVDAAAPDRMGGALSGFSQADINIDHHVTNTRFATINIIDPGSVATCAMLAEAFPELGLSFSPAVVDALLTGLLTDTMGLHTSNMNPQALRIAADLVEKGADLPMLYERALLRRSFEALRYWGAGLSKLQREGGLVWTSLSLAERKASGYTANDDAELVNNVAFVAGAVIVVLFIEQVNNEVKISWRSQGDVDVSKIAAQFAGGGHVPAAGAVVQGSLEEVQHRVLQATRAMLQSVPV
ncbi:MAG TPA: bifunctional oligoribonuclease/PAP phosphatase NrnA [Anaerolineales bacterium]|nr:bifunctional oligoribonuclease/PAP phosphatase NrnA [Anaerolineales bacterium]